MAEPSHAQLSREIGELTATVRESQKSQDRRLGDMERKLDGLDGRLQAIEHAAGWGRGAGWMLIKVGVFMGALGTLAVGAWRVLNG